MSTGELAQPSPAGSTNPALSRVEMKNPLWKSGKEDVHAAYARPEIPETVSIWDVCSKRYNVYTEEQKTKAWTDAAGMVQSHSDDMIARWNKEIDTYLVFAGLFSAILTAFNVQSYLLLQPSAPDPSIAVLQQISSQLASFSINPPFVNSTQPSNPSPTNANTPSPVLRWAVWLNALWFSGLILSLTSASVGIMVKQWLNEYSSGVSGTSRPVARVRQYRLHNLQRWHVEDIVGTIPILLQLSLALFLSGLLVLLWNLHSTVAAVASTLVGLLAAFTAVTTLLPLFDHKCAYLSPHVRTLHALWQPKCFAFWVCLSISRGRRDVAAFLTIAPHMLSILCQRLRLYASLDYWKVLWRKMRAAAGRLSELSSPPETWRARKQSWKGQERSAVDELASELDKQILLEAYSATLHPDALSAASVCLMNSYHEDVIDYFRKLHTSVREHFGPVADSGGGPLGWGNQQELLWLHIILCVLLEDQSPLSDDEAAALGVYFGYGLWSSGMRAADAEWATAACDAISDYIEVAGTSFKAAFIDQDRLTLKRSSLIYNAVRREQPLTSVLLPAVTGAYRQVRLKQARLAEATWDDAKDAHTGFIKNIDHFFGCADLALASSLPADDLDTVRTYARDVLAELTRTLLELFAEDKVRTVIVSTHLDDLMRTLRYFDRAHVEECIPDDLLPDILRLMERLASASGYVDNDYVEGIQKHARTFMETIVRVKCKSETPRSPETVPAEPTATEVATVECATVPSAHSGVDDTSGSARDPGGRSHGAHAGSPSNGVS
ncbi:hypothetical protein VTO73DRAFT_2429 [Trametes versicolor]